jgi:hypothetical protein
MWLITGAHHFSDLVIALTIPPFVERLKAIKFYRKG